MGAIPGDAQAHPVARFRRITTAQGLSDSRVRAILQDRVGFLWVGTVDGLARYDGRRFQTFRHVYPTPAASGRASSWPCMRIGTARSGLAYGGAGSVASIPRTETFRHYRHDPSDRHSLSQDDVADIAVDRGGRCGSPPAEA